MPVKRWWPCFFLEKVVTLKKWQSSIVLLSYLHSLLHSVSLQTAYAISGWRSPIWFDRTSQVWILHYSDWSSYSWLALGFCKTYGYPGRVLMVLFPAAPRVQYYKQILLLDSRSQRSVYLARTGFRQHRPVPNWKCALLNRGRAYWERDRMADTSQHWSWNPYCGRAHCTVPGVCASIIWVNGTYNIVESSVECLYAAVCYVSV